MREKYVSFSVGGAITALSNPEQEYEVFIKVKSNARCFSMKIITVE
jgi:anthranilate/para-aminobenzoate synthase component I